MPGIFLDGFLILYMYEKIADYDAVYNYYLCLFRSV